MGTLSATLLTAPMLWLLASPGHRSTRLAPLSSGTVNLSNVLAKLRRACGHPSPSKRSILCDRRTVDEVK